MLAVSTNRPRNVDAPRAAAILYGDWGTSKVYVIGLAFAIAGYSSFWLILAMCALTALVGVNYISVCKHYPDGGGVYASVRQRSEIVSIIGAFALVGGYIVTAAISSLSAFLYLRFPHPEIFAAVSILVVGALNYFGPRHTGGLAFLISVPAVAIVILLGLFGAPHLGDAVRNLKPLSVETLKYLRHFQRSSYADASRAHPAPDVQEEAENLMQGYFTYLLERELNTPGFLKSIKE